MLQGKDQPNTRAKCSAQHRPKTWGKLRAFKNSFLLQIRMCSKFHANFVPNSLTKSRRTWKSFAGEQRHAGKVAPGFSRSIEGLKVSCM
jgi:hypothetical protein